MIEPHIVNMYNEFKNSNSRILVETGCHLGNRLVMSYELGFTKMYSCDIFEERVNHCNMLSKQLGFDLTCMHKWSVPFLKDILPSINDRVLFWLDAHEEGGGVPTLEELDIIAEHSIKNHDIFIDDMNFYFTHNRQELQNKILKINPNYKIKFIDSISPNNILIAKIP